MRTTIDIDDPILRDLKELQRIEGKSLGRLTSDLLAQALADRLQDSGQVQKPSIKWESQLMDAKIDLLDKSALMDLMDEPLGKGSR